MASRAKQTEIQYDMCVYVEVCDSWRWPFWMWLIRLAGAEAESGVLLFVQYCLIFAYSTLSEKKGRDCTKKFWGGDRGLNQLKQVDGDSFWNMAPVLFISLNHHCKITQ